MSDVVTVVVDSVVEVVFVEANAVKVNAPTTVARTVSNTKLIAIVFLSIFSPPLYKSSIIETIIKRFFNIRTYFLQNYDQKIPKLSNNCWFTRETWSANPMVLSSMEYRIIRYLKKTDAMLFEA